MLQATAKTRRRRYRKRALCVRAYYSEIDPYAAHWLRNLIAAGHIAAGKVDERDIREVERLQRGYLVDREKESVLVPTDQLTDTELDAKANEYGRMAEGCRLHALELRRYRMQRAA